MDGKDTVLRSLEYIYHLSVLALSLLHPWMPDIRLQLMSKASQLVECDFAGMADELKGLVLDTQAIFRCVYVEPPDVITNTAVRVSSKPRPLARAMRERLFFGLVCEKFNEFYYNQCVLNAKVDEFIPIVLPPMLYAKRHDALLHFHHKDEHSDIIWNKVNAGQPHARVVERVKDAIDIMQDKGELFCYESIPIRTTNFPETVICSTEDLEFLNQLKAVSQQGGGSAEARHDLLAIAVSMHGLNEPSSSNAGHQHPIPVSCSSSSEPTTAGPSSATTGIPPHFNDFPIPEINSSLPYNPVSESWQAVSADAAVIDSGYLHAGPKVSEASCGPALSSPNVAMTQTGPMTNWSRTQPPIPVACSSSSEPTTAGPSGVATPPTTPGFPIPEIDSSLRHNPASESWQTVSAGDATGIDSGTPHAEPTVSEASFGPVLSSPNVEMTQIGPITSWSQLLALLDQAIMLDGQAVDKPFTQLQTELVEVRQAVRAFVNESEAVKVVLQPFVRLSDGRPVAANVVADLMANKIFKSQKFVCMLSGLDSAVRNRTSCQVAQQVSAFEDFVAVMFDMAAAIRKHRTGEHFDSTAFSSMGKELMNCVHFYK